MVTMQEPQEKQAGEVKHSSYCANTVSFDLE